MRVVRTAMALWNKTNDPSLVSEEIELGNGLTIGELVERVSRDVFGFKISEKVAGNVVVDGKRVPMQSQSIGEPEIVFIINYYQRKM